MIEKTADKSTLCSTQTGGRGCCSAPSGQLLLGIRQFNSRQWFECHETLEALWLVETGEVRDFCQGMLQIAIALNHWRNGNFNGSVKLLESGTAYLKRVATPCMWVDVAGLIRQTTAMQAALLELGEADMAALAPETVPQITTVAV